MKFVCEYCDEPFTNIGQAIRHEIKCTDVYKNKIHFYDKDMNPLAITGEEYDIAVYLKIDCEAAMTLLHNLCEEWDAESPYCDEIGVLLQWDPYEGWRVMEED